MKSIHLLGMTTALALVLVPAHSVGAHAPTPHRR